MNQFSRTALGLLLVLLGGLLLWGGVEGAYLSWTNPSVTTLSCREWMSRRVQARWVRLTQCKIDYRKGFVIHEKGYDPKDKEHPNLYRSHLVPLLPSGARTRKPIKVFVQVSRDAERRLIDRLLALKPRHLAAQRARFVQKHKQAIVQVRSVQGMLRYRDRLNGETYSKIARTVPYRLAQPYAVLDEGMRPMGLASLVVVGFGALTLLAGLGLTLRLFWGRQNPAAPSAPPPAAAA